MNCNGFFCFFFHFKFNFLHIPSIFTIHQGLKTDLVSEHKNLGIGIVDSTSLNFISNSRYETTEAETYMSFIWVKENTCLCCFYVFVWL